jgi:hypothetical protein
MRRSKESPDPAARPAFPSQSGTKIPSTELVDLFGRFVGIVLSTLFEGCFKNSGRSGDFQSELTKSMNDILNRFSGGASPRDDEGSGDLDEEAPTVETAKSGANKSEPEREAETQIADDLSELKRRLSERLIEHGEDCDRCISLISRSTSILRSGGEWNFHICPFSGKPVFEGFISFLTKARGGNPIDTGLMSVTVSSQNSGDAKNVPAFGDNSHFRSQNLPNQWLCYDFKDLRPSVTHYVIRSNGNQGYCHLRSTRIIRTTGQQ